MNRRATRRRGWPSSSIKKNSYSIPNEKRAVPALLRRKTVLATGVFDLLHLGHLRFLEESKRKGGPKSKLVVVVARDKTVRLRKGKGPVYPEDQRRELVSALRVVDLAILGHEEFDLLGILKEVKPDIVCVGYDQNEIGAAVADLIKRRGLPIRVIRIRRFGPLGFDSSTRVKRRVAKAVSVV